MKRRFLLRRDAAMVRTVVLCIDRDNDLGTKTGIKGPVVGEARCTRAAVKLLLADPSESDANAIFAAIKTKRSLKNSEVVVLTGDPALGIKSDRAIRKQLKSVVKKLKPKEAVVVSDGSSDEFILPVIQSIIPIASVQRVVVRQSEGMETGYYLLKSYWQEIVSQPERARVVLGIPAIILIILAVFGSAGISLVLATIGFYLLVKAFRIEGFFTTLWHEFAFTLHKGRVTFFLYVLSLIFLAIGAIVGYRKSAVFLSYDATAFLATFFYTATPLLFVSAFLFLTGKLLVRKIGFTIYLRIVTLVFGISLILYYTGEYLLTPAIGFANITYAIFVSFVLLTLVILFEQVRKSE